MDLRVAGYAVVRANSRTSGSLDGSCPVKTAKMNKNRNLCELPCNFLQLNSNYFPIFFARRHVQKLSTRCYRLLHQNCITTAVRRLYECVLHGSGECPTLP